MAKTICVVDDEEDLREELKIWLGDCGYHVVTAESGSDALEKLKTIRPHLMLLDVIMPQISGFDVLTHMKQNDRTADIPVIMLTAKRESNLIMKAQEMNVADYVTKPFREEDLLRSIERNIL